MLMQIYWTCFISAKQSADINERQEKQLSFRVSRKVIDFRNCVKRKIG
jgi:hypothetical protein